MSAMTAKKMYGAAKSSMTAPQLQFHTPRAPATAATVPITGIHATNNAAGAARAHHNPM